MSLLPIGYLDAAGTFWRLGQSWEANYLLTGNHYLGPLRSGGVLTIIGERDEAVVAAMIFRYPTSRRLPADRTWLELSRWCLTPWVGENGGSRMHRWSLRLVKEHLPNVTTLVSYSDPQHGHTGALYRACNWQWAPTWMRLRPPPSGGGAWRAGEPQAVKDRWVFPVGPDDRRASVLGVDDMAALRHWCENATETEKRWARRSIVPLVSTDTRAA